MHFVVFSHNKHGDDRTSQLRLYSLITSSSWVFCFMTGLLYKLFHVIRSLAPLFRLSNNALPYRPLTFLPSNLPSIFHFPVIGLLLYKYPIQFFCLHSIRPCLSYLLFVIQHHHICLADLQYLPSHPHIKCIKPVCLLQFFNFHARLQSTLYRMTTLDQTLHNFFLQIKIHF